MKHPHSYNIDDNIVDGIKKLADKKDRSQSYIVNEALSEKIARELEKEDKILVKQN